MKEWREYHCESNHFWEYLKDVEDPELPGEISCRCGQEAVMARKVKAVGVMVSIIPMARELDSVTGKVGLTNKYYLRIESLDGDFVRISNKHFFIDELHGLVKSFTGVDKRLASRLWKLKKLGDHANRIENSDVE